MSNTAIPTSNSSSPPSPILSPIYQSTTMAIPTQSNDSTASRRGKITAKLQTTFLPSLNSHSVPTSAVSSSSVASSTQHSPIMSPQLNQLVTSNSSIQPSPEGPRGRDVESLPTAFELPESIVSHKSSQSAMSEAIQASKSTGLIRRLSNKASKFAGRRRQSSNTAMNREHSSGPVIMRRRSDSNSTAPDANRPSLYADSEEETLNEITYEESIPDMADGISTNGSMVTPVTTNINANDLSDGPVIPRVLLQGTVMTKMTKKKKKKNLNFILDIERAKVSWDKNKTSKSFYIDDIKEIRSGADARNYRQEFGVSLADESRFFSIVYAIPDKSKGRAQKILHLIAQDDQTCEFWTSTLDAISKHRHDFMASLSAFNDKAVKSYWQREMSRKFGDKAHDCEDEEIDVVGVERLCRSMHINMSGNLLHSKFKEADISKTGRLNFAEFQGFVKLMKQREDVRAIYRGISANADQGVTLEEFLYFLRDSQNEDVDGNRCHWENVFAKFVRRSKPREQQHLCSEDEPKMNEQGLTSFLTSTYNVPIHELPSQLVLDRPLNEYFISSSHNTYLLGRQVAGQSSVEAYITALLRGCRCVEVDCWNGPQGPVVMHGRTLTSQVSFVDVMSTIRKYAFVKTSFPLWISLEVHCNAVQQAEMAKIIKETCGDALVTEPVDSNTNTLPTPMDLLSRILIKVKRPHVENKPAETESSFGRRRGNSLNNSVTSPFLRPSQLDNPSIPPQSPLMSPQHRLTRMISNRQMRIAAINEIPDSASSSTSDSDSLNEEVKAGEDFPANRKKTSKIVPVLGDLGVYSAGLKFHGFESPEAKTYNHIFSFMEQTFAKNSKNPDDRHALILHNMRYMMRVYPNGWRLASTNFDPLTYWRRGVQMAALNWQTYDLGMQINDAMFAAGSDQTGYVLKPAELRGPIRLNAVDQSLKIKKSRKNVSFEVDVISAQQLMRPKNLGSSHSFDPYVEVEVYHADDKGKESKGVVGEGGQHASVRDGPSGLGTPHRRRTQIVEQNGFNPVYDKKFVFNLTTKYPDLIFIRFSIRNSSASKDYSDRGPPLATYTVKLGSIKQGYRTIPLMDANGDQFLFSTLFCRIKIDAPTTLYLEESEVPNSIGVLKSLGRKLAGNPMSPKSSIDSN